MQFIDSKRALELLEMAVAERGADYVYEPVGADRQCVYVHNGQPSCMIGLALALHGVPIESLDGIYKAAGVLHQEVPGLTSTAALVFDYAQMSQDAGLSWGSALEAARSVAA